MSDDSIKRRDRELFEHQSKDDLFYVTVTAKELFEVLQQWMVGRMTSHPAYSRGLNCVDVGCGAGANSEWLGEFGKYIIGLDHTSRRVALSSQRLPDRNKFGFMVADGELLPFKNRVIDVVFCSSILHHLPNYREALSSYKQCMDDDGLIIAAEPCAYNPFAVIRRKFFPSETHTPDERPFPPKEIIEEFKKNYENVTYERFYLFSVNAPLVERILGLRAARIYYKVSVFLDRILLRIPLLKELCWEICLVGYNRKVGSGSN